MLLAMWEKHQYNFVNICVREQRKACQWKNWKSKLFARFEQTTPSVNISHINIVAFS